MYFLFQEQAPILDHSRNVVEKVDSLTTIASKLFEAKTSTEDYREHRKALENAAEDLRSCVW